MRKLLLLLTFCIAATGFGAVLAQAVRALPAKGERGTTGESQPLPFVKVGNRVLRLSPGGLIFDQDNRMIVHGHLPASADILYTRDQAGDIQRIYILTEQEKVRLDQARKR